jgi:hypothetical protein
VEALRHIDKLYSDVCEALPMIAGPEDEAADVVKLLVTDLAAARAVTEQAFRAGYRACVDDREAPDIVHGSEDAAWLAWQERSSLLPSHSENDSAQKIEEIS